MGPVPSISAFASSSARSGRRARNPPPYSYAVAGRCHRDRPRSCRVHHHAHCRARRARARARCGDVLPGAVRAFAVTRHSPGLAAIRSGEAEKLEGELPYEIRPLQQELNALIQSNREIVERARTHVGNLAHALKTPLSVISNEARTQERAARGQGDRAGRDHAHPDHPSSRPGAGRGAFERDRRDDRGRCCASGAEADASTASTKSAGWISK